jgi:hypothetical protein
VKVSSLTLESFVSYKTKFSASFAQDYWLS